MMGMDQRASSTFPLIVLFGVILAFLMAFLFISLYNQQLNAQVDEPANALANNLALMAFTSLSGGQPILELPRDVGGSTYKIAIEKEGIFTVTITGGRGTGSSYSAIVSASLKADNQDFSPGGRVYFQENRGQIIVSPLLIENIPAEISVENISLTPPSFYGFAKDHPKVASAIIAAYYHTFENIVYYWENENNKNSMIVRTDSSVLHVVNGYENNDNTGLIENIWRIKSAWIVLSVENFDSTLTSPILCPSVENAWKSGWLYSPSQALEQLRGRTWQRVIDNVMVTVPDNAIIHAAAATVVLYQENVSTYPTWRVEWQGDQYYVIYFRAMPWWENDNAPGFVFQSNPTLYPVV